MSQEHNELLEDNPYDNISSGIMFDPDKIKAQEAKLRAEYAKRDHLIHKVFAQTEDGRELLKMWIDNVILKKPVAIKGADHSLIDIGITQGMQDFVRGIMVTCEKVEKGDV